MTVRTRLVRLQRAAMKARGGLRQSPVLTIVEDPAWYGNTAHDGASRAIVNPDWYGSEKAADQHGAEGLATADPAPPSTLSDTMQRPEDLTR